MAMVTRLNEQGEIRFYEWLEDKIREEGTAVALSEKVGISQGALSALRKGAKAPTEQMVDRIASAYDLTIKDIIGTDGTTTEDVKPRGDRTGAKVKRKKEVRPEDSIPLFFIDTMIEDIELEIKDMQEAVGKLELKMEVLRSIKDEWTEALR